MSTKQHTIRCPHCEKQFEFLMLTATPEEAEGIKKMFEAIMQSAKANPAKIFDKAKHFEKLHELENDQ